MAALEQPTSRWVDHVVEPKLAGASSVPGDGEGGAAGSERNGVEQASIMAFSL